MESSRWVVEIGEHKVRAVFYQPSAGGCQIQRMVSADIPTGDDGLGQSLRQIFGSSSNAKRRADLLLSRHQASVQIIKFPSTDESEIFSMSRIRILKHFPYDEKDAVISHRVLGAMDGHSTVQMIWAVKTGVLTRCDALSACGVEVEKVVFGGEALERWLSDSQPEVRGKKILFVHLGEDRLEIQIIDHGIPVFSRGIKRTRSGEWHREVEASLAGYDETLLGRIEGVYFCGEDADAGWMRSLAADMEIPFRQVGPYQGLSESLSKQAQLDPSFASLLSACREMGHLKIDMTPPEIVERSKKAALKKEGRFSLIWIAAILLFSAILAIRNESERRATLTRLDAQIQSVKPKAESVEKIRRFLKAAKDIAQAKPRAADIFLEVHRLTPSAIALESLDYEERRRMVLHGSATDLGMVSGYAAKLEQSAFFSEAKVLYTKNQEGSDSPTVDFEIQTKVDEVTAHGV